MSKKTETLESAHFSTGNGGMTFEIVRASYGTDASYHLVHELSHYGVRQIVQIPVNDIEMMDEMILMMQRARAAMPPVPSYYQTSRIYRKVIDGVPVKEPEPDPKEMMDESYGEDMSDTDEEDASVINKVMASPSVKVATFGQFSKAKPPGP
jgi:hypothetical protein